MPESNTPLRILHLDDDPLQLELARTWLQTEGHEVEGVQSGREAIEALRRDRFDLAILDWVLPGLSGEDVLLAIRESGPRMPVLFATSKQQEAEVAHILGLGADDCVVKPLRRLEFLARVNALARRAGLSEPRATENTPPYELDLASHTVSLNGKTIPMSDKMADLVFYLFENRDRVVTRKEIFKRVWRLSKPIQSRTIDTFVSRLRALLELDGRHGWRIVSVYQDGYRLAKTSWPGGAGT